MDAIDLGIHLVNHSDKEATDLLVKMVSKSQVDDEYNAAMSAWLKDPKTADLRTLAEPFGDYWKDLAFQNAVDSIDSASLHAQDGSSRLFEVELKRSRSCIASLLERFDEVLGSGMHLQGQAPDWYVDAAAISSGLIPREGGGAFQSGPVSTRASMPDTQSLRKIGTEPVIIDASCYGPIPDVCLELGIWTDGEGHKWAKMEGEFHKLLPGNRLKLKEQDNG